MLFNKSIRENNLLNIILILLIAGAGWIVGACNLAASAPTEAPTESIAEARATATPTQTATPTVTASPTRATAAATACAPRADWMSYTVVSGDTLGSIARRAGATVDELARANCLADANRISVGQVVRVPALLPPAATPTAISNIGNVPLLASDGSPAAGQCWVAHPGSTAIVTVYQNPPPLNGGAASGLVGYLSDWAAVTSASYNGWYKVVFSDGTSGWVDGALVTQGGVCPPLILLKDELPIVGDVAGAPDLTACWASNAGEGALVYDAPQMDPMAAKAILSNRALVQGTQNDGYYIINYVPDGVGYVRVGDVTLIGDCSGLWDTD